MSGVGTSYRGAPFSERMASAPCMETDPDLSFPAGSGKLSKEHDLAKRDCERCPLALREECLELALRTEGKAAAANRYGVFGGLDPVERAALAKERRARAAELPGLVQVAFDSPVKAGPNQVAVSQVVGHIRSLLDAGHTRTAVAEASGVSHSVICTLATSIPHFIKASTYAALMSVREASEVAA